MTGPITTHAGPATFAAPSVALAYEHADTRALVELVTGAAELVREKGANAFDELRVQDSRWRSGDTYIFVLDLDGNMLVHPDPSLEGHNQIGLLDVNGKPIVRGLIDAATIIPGRDEGWFHYQWPVPNGLLPRWKSSYVRRVEAPGKQYVVGCGMYNDRMERAFVMDAVRHAVEEIEKRGRAAFPLFHDPKGPYIVKDAYIFIFAMDGIALVNPAFPNLEGANMLELKDTAGKYIHRGLAEVVRGQGAGWFDYMWPKPGESVSTQKSTYVSAATLDGQPVMVGCGVYLADAPREAQAPGKLTAPELKTLVAEAAALLEKDGERAYAELRTKGSKWFRDDTYFFVWTMDGTRLFHAPAPEIEGEYVADLADVVHRPYGRQILGAAAGPSAEGWVHYMYPEPGNVIPVWKSTFVRRVTFPSGAQRLVGSGIYNMQMEPEFVEDMVNRAAALVAERGRAAFPILRDRTGPFVFMDTYIFVESTDGIELVNAAQPSLEGRMLWDLRDLKGRTLVRDEVQLAVEKGSGWLDVYWYKPGNNEPGRKRTFVKAVHTVTETLVVGCGIYLD